MSVSANGLDPCSQGLQTKGLADGCDLADDGSHYPWVQSSSLPSLLPPLSHVVADCAPLIQNPLAPPAGWQIVHVGVLDEVGTYTIAHLFNDTTTPTR